jgi:hypothetical protein
VKTLIAATALIALSIPAYAWTSDPPQTNVTANPSARSGAIAASRSSSSSAASARGGRVSNRITVNNSTGTGSGVDPATLAALEAGRGGWGDGQQLPAASAYAPSFYGANPCTGPASSLGAQFQLFGLSVGGQSMDRVCQLLELHQDRAALEYLCDQDSGVRNALARTGSPCMADRQTPVTPVNDNPTPPAPVHHPAWCKRARPTTEASRIYVHQECE